MPAETLAEIAWLKAKKVVILGGTSAVSDDMAAKAAKALGLAKATRVAGADRFSTCVEVNKRGAFLYPKYHTDRKKPIPRVRPALIIMPRL